MLIGFEVVSARSKKTSDEDDTPVREPMRGDRKLLNNPSTDQKKERRRQQKTSSEEIQSQAKVRDWYHKRRRAELPKSESCEFCDNGDKACPTCGYHPTKRTAFQERMAQVIREDHNVR